MILFAKQEQTPLLENAMEYENTIDSLEDLQWEDAAQIAGSISGGSESLPDQAVKKKIGTLKERSLHSFLKQYYEPLEAYHETPVGPYVADICKDGKITEIQTRQFSKMRAKLAYYLKCNYTVEIVYPVRENKWLVWINQETGEVASCHKSPKKGSVYDCLRELICLRDLLPHPQLSVSLAFCDVEDWRFLNGWSKDKKRGSVRADSVPLQFNRSVALVAAEDYSVFLPNVLRQEGMLFDTKMLTKHAAITQHSAQMTCYLLHHIGYLQRMDRADIADLPPGLTKRGFVYQCNKETSFCKKKPDL